MGLSGLGIDGGINGAILTSMNERTMRVSRWNNGLFDVVSREIPFNSRFGPATLRCEVKRSLPPMGRRYAMRPLWWIKLESGFSFSGPFGKDAIRKHYGVGDAVFGRGSKLWELRGGGVGAGPVGFVVAASSEDEARDFGRVWLNDHWFRDERQVWIEQARVIS